MKIAIVTAVWKRHEIFELFAKGIHELEKINGVRHASHYLSAGNNYSVRFNTDNIWVSCYKCNVMLSGNQLEYRKRLIEKIGIERVEYLESIAKETVKYTVEDLQNIIKEFKEKIKLLNN